MKPMLKMGCRRNQFQAILDLGRFVVTSMTGNANFPTPVPTLVSVTAELDTLETCIDNWGEVGNRGSHAQYLALVSAAQTTFDTLLILMDYVENTAAGDEPALISSGYPLKNAPSPQGVLGAPQDGRQLFQPTVPLSTPKIKWEKPLGVTSPGNVKGYKIFRNETGVFDPDDLIGMSTKTSFIDTTAEPAKNYTYFVAAYNTAGNGVPSAAIGVSTPAA